MEGIPRQQRSRGAHEEPPLGNEKQSKKGSRSDEPTFPSSPQGSVSQLLSQLVESFIYEGYYYDHLRLVPERIAEQANVRAIQHVDALNMVLPAAKLLPIRRAINVAKGSPEHGAEGRESGETLSPDQRMSSNATSSILGTDVYAKGYTHLDMSYNSSSGGTHNNNPFNLSYNQLTPMVHGATQTGSPVYHRHYSMLGASRSASSIAAVDSTGATGGSDFQVTPEVGSVMLTSHSGGASVVRSPIGPRPSVPLPESDELTATSTGPFAGPVGIFHPLRATYLDGRRPSAVTGMPTFFASDRRQEDDNASNMFRSTSSARPNDGAMDNRRYTRLAEHKESLRVAEVLLVSLLRPDDSAAVVESRDLPSSHSPMSTRPNDLSAQVITNFIVEHSKGALKTKAQKNLDTDDSGAHPALKTNPEWLILYTAETPATSLQTYCSRVVTGLQLDPEQVVVALCLMRRAACYAPLCTRSAHRQFLVAVLLASKLRLDVVWTLKHYARCGGVTQSELGAMEVALLDVLGFDVGVSTTEYIEMLYSLRHHCATMAYVNKCDWAATAWAAVATLIPLPSLERLRSEYECKIDALVKDWDNYRDISNGGDPFIHSTDSRRGDTISPLPTDPNRFLSSFSTTSAASSTSVEHERQALKKDRGGVLSYRYRYNGAYYPPLGPFTKSLLPKRWDEPMTSGHDKIAKDPVPAAKDVGRGRRQSKAPAKNASTSAPKQGPSWAERCATATAAQSKRGAQNHQRHVDLSGAPVPPVAPLPIISGHDYFHPPHAAPATDTTALVRPPLVVSIPQNAAGNGIAHGGGVVAQQLSNSGRVFTHPSHVLQSQPAYIPIQHKAFAENGFSNQDFHPVQGTAQNSNESSFASVNATGSGTFTGSDMSQHQVPPQGLVIAPPPAIGPHHHLASIPNTFGGGNNSRNESNVPHGTVSHHPVLLTYPLAVNPRAMDNNGWSVPQTNERQDPNGTFPSQMRNPLPVTALPMHSSSVTPRLPIDLAKAHTEHPSYYHQQHRPPQFMPLPQNNPTGAQLPPYNPHMGFIPQPQGQIGQRPW